MDEETAKIVDRLVSFNFSRNMGSKTLLQGKLLSLVSTI